MGRCSKLIYELLGTNVSEDVKLDKVRNKLLLKSVSLMLWEAMHNVESPQVHCYIKLGIQSL